jgi:hypothetical protein
VLVVRRPLSALTVPERRPGAVALVAVMLGSVAFDGFSRSTMWQNHIYDLRGRFSSEAAGDRAEMALNMAVLLLAIAIVAAAYTLAVAGAARVAGEGVDGEGQQQDQQRVDGMGGDEHRAQDCGARVR